MKNVFGKEIRYFRVCIKDDFFFRMDFCEFGRGCDQKVCFLDAVLRV